MSAIRPAGGAAYGSISGQARQQPTGSNRTVEVDGQATRITFTSRARLFMRSQTKEQKDLFDEARAALFDTSTPPPHMEKSNRNLVIGSFLSTYQFSVIAQSSGNGRHFVSNLLM
jgi:hypothetical protein